VIPIRALAAQMQVSCDRDLAPAAQ